MGRRLELLDLHVMMIVTVRRQAPERLISLDLRENKFRVSSRDSLRRSLHRLRLAGVLHHDKEAQSWVLTSYDLARAWCQEYALHLEDQDKLLKHTSAVISEMTVTMEKLQDQIITEGAWHGRWIKKARLK